MHRNIPEPVITVHTTTVVHVSREIREHLLLVSVILSSWTTTIEISLDSYDFTTIFEHCKHIVL